jgi:hypothetical protein
MHGYGTGVQLEYSTGDDVSHNLIQRGPTTLIAVAYTENSYFGYDDLRCGVEDGADTGLFAANSNGASTPSNAANTVEQLRAWGANWNLNSGLPSPQGCVDAHNHYCSFRPYGVYLDQGADYWTLRNICLADYDMSALQYTDADGPGYNQNGASEDASDVSWEINFDPGGISRQIGLCPNFRFREAPPPLSNCGP